MGQIPPPLHPVALSNADKQFIRRALWKAIQSWDEYADLTDRFGVPIPDEAWDYMRDREDAIARLLSICLLPAPDWGDAVPSTST